jgi:RNA polymerase-binding transcription factor DksA
MTTDKIKRRRSGTEYQKLQAERERTQAELKRLRSYLEDEVERVIDGSEDSVDAASDVYEREKTLAIIQTLDKKLASVEHALQTAEKGGYGVCEICGKPIDPARLAVMPQSTTCIKCQEKLERQQHRRPLAAFSLRDEE